MEDGYAVSLVVSELVTNAIQHASPPISLHLCWEWVGRGVLVEVFDGGASKKAADSSFSRAQDECGRGMSIIDHLAARRGIEELENGASHWAILG